MRLDKFLSELGICTRSESKKILKSGAITVNDNIVKDGSFHVNEVSDIIKYNGEELSYEKFFYYMLNKPSGVVSATEDNLSKTVLDLFDVENKNDLFPVGRLDKDTTGLLIITNDGELSHRLTSPKSHVSKTYLVGIEHSLSSKDIFNLENGVELIDDGLTKPAKVKVIDENTILLTITEGKYHQVKRMLAAVNNKVISLKRLSIGNLVLDEALAEGSYRRLTLEELRLIKE